MSLGLAFRCFFRVLAGKPVPPEALPPQPEKPALPPPDPAKEHAVALHLLSILQKEGRLVDFLQEDISSYDDAQIGAAVRNIHRDCHSALAEHVKLVRVMDGDEDADITVPAGFNPAEVRLSGNVTGDPPFNGVLRHAGWRASRLELPEFTGKQDKLVIQPAEVEIR